MCEGVGSVGKRLRYAREASGLSPKELEAMAGMSRGHINQIESEQKGLGAISALKIRCVLGVSLDWLLAGSGSRPSRKSIRRAFEAARDGVGICGDD